MNDYVVVVIKINSKEVSQFYGKAKYLLQVWKNKRRLFQHIHNHDVKTIYLNKTEFTYILNAPIRDELKQLYDNHLNFVYAVQPFTQKFARIRYVFEDSYYMDVDNFDQI